MFNLFKVQGMSLSPVLSPDDYVITSRFFRKLKEGELVVVQHPVYDRIIKRIHAINEQGELLLSGENRESVTPEQMGWIPPQQLLGKVRFIIRQ